MSNHKNEDISVVVLPDTLGNSIESRSHKLQKFTQNMGIDVEIFTDEIFETLTRNNKIG